MHTLRQTFGEYKLSFYKCIIIPGFSLLLFHSEEIAHFIQNSFIHSEFKRKVSKDEKLKEIKKTVSQEDFLESNDDDLNGKIMISILKQYSTKIPY